MSGATGRDLRRAAWVLVTVLHALFPMAAGVALAQTAPAKAANQSADKKADDDEARGHLKRGDELYAAGDFTAAAAEYEAGYTISHRVGFLINIGQSYRRAGDLKTARRWFKKYLAIEVDAGQRRPVEEIVRDIDEALAEELPPAALLVPPVVPVAASAPTPAPPPSIALAAPPAPPASRDAGLAAPTPAVESGTADRERRSPVYRKLWFWAVVAGAVLAGTATALVLGRSDVAGAKTCGSLGCRAE